MTQGTRARRFIIIRRGATEVFEELRARFAGDPWTVVMYDRRLDSRRRLQRQNVPDKRRGERRLPHDRGILANRGFFATRADRSRRAS